MEKTAIFPVFAIINLLVFIAVISVNAAANAVPLNGVTTGELSDFYPNLFVPAGLTFSIWGVIYLLLAGFSIYGIRASFSTEIDSGFLTKIGPWFIISCIANICWILAWHWKSPALSLIFMLIILASLIVIYIKVGGINDKPTFQNKLFLKLPFSIYLGWITVATIANITALLVAVNWNQFGISQEIWTIILIAAAVIITCLIIYNRQDIGYAIVILWALLGIILKRSSAADAPAIIIAAAAGMIFITVFFLIKSLIFK